MLIPDEILFFSIYFQPGWLTKMKFSFKVSNLLSDVSIYASIHSLHPSYRKSFVLFPKENIIIIFL